MKKVLVTGSTRGIGKALVKEFKKDFFVVGLASAKEDNLVDQYIKCDLTSNDQLEEACTIVSQLEIDVLINNAGINRIAPFCDIDPNDFLAIQKINVYAPFRLCQTVLPSMSIKGWGRIVNISSVWGKISKAGRASYSASKFAIDGMTVAIANEYASKGILANSISPGFVDTEMTRQNLTPIEISQRVSQIPINRIASPEEIAKFAKWLCTEENTYISGQNIAIDGGFTRA